MGRTATTAHGLIPAEPVVRFTELIEHLAAHDIRLSVDGDLLRYEGPAGALNETLLAELRRHKAELLRWLAEAGSRPRAPASRVQRLIWGAIQSATDPGAHNVTMRVRLSGSLDPEALRQAFTALLARHSILRTRLVLDGERLYQVIDPPTAMPIPTLDLAALPARARPAELDAWCRREASRPFDITAEHPIRFLLARETATESVLLVVQHHLVTDAWSLAVLFEELSALYTARVLGRPAELPPAPQYTDFSAWEAEYLTPTRIAQAVEFWGRELAGAPLHINFPYDRDPPAQPSWRGGLCVFPIEPDLSEAVARRARQCGSTPYPFLASAFALQMAETTGEHDLLLAGTIANRSRQEFERMLGVFTNSVVLRVRVDWTQTFAELTRQTSQMFYRCLDHQSVPFWAVARALSLPTGPGTVFDQMKFTVNNTPPATLDLPGLRAEVFDAQPEGSKFDFGVLVISEQTGQKVFMEYRKDRFSHATIDNFGRRYVRLLRLVTTDPDLSLGEAVRRSYQEIDAEPRSR